MTGKATLAFVAAETMGGPFVYQDTTMSACMIVAQWDTQAEPNSYTHQLIIHTQAQRCDWWGI